MSERRLEDELARRLHRAGARRRYTQRVVDELHDHAEELRALSRAREHPPASESDVEARVRERIGDPESLARAFLADPRAFPMARRRPRLVFGLFPFIILELGFVAFAMAVIGIATLADAGSSADLRSPEYAWLHEILAYLFFAAQLVVPLAVAAAYTVLARRARTSFEWLLVAAAVLVVGTGITTLEFQAPTLGTHDEFTIGLHIGASWAALLRIGIPLAALAVVWILHLRRERTDP